MTMYIPSDVEQLARLVATKTGKTPDDIVKEAIEARAAAEGVTVSRQRPFDEAKVMAIIKRVSNLPVLDTRTDNEILGYNEHGAFD